MKGERGYTPRQVEAVTGVPYRTIDYYDRAGFIKPSVAPARGAGRGRTRLYSFVDLVRLRAARELREEGVPLQTVRRVVRKLKLGAALAFANQAEHRLVAAGKRACVVGSPGELLDALTGQTAFALVLGLAPLVRDVQARVEGIEETA